MADETPAVGVTARSFHWTIRSGICEIQRTIDSEIRNSNNALDRRCSIRIFERPKTCRYALHERIGISWIHDPVTFSSAKIQAHESGVVIWHHEGLGMAPFNASKFQTSRQLHRPLVRQSLRDPGS